MKVDEPFEQRKADQAVHGALTDYLVRGGCEDTADLEEEMVTSLLKVFLDACHRELRIPPADLDEDSLREVLLRKMPRRIAAKRRGSELGVRVVRDFYEYDQGSGPRTLSPERAKVFEEAEERFPDLLAGGEVESSTAVEPLRAEGAKVGRNDPCPCGSGKKAKKCCGVGG